jgi:hypothetical protein
LGKILYNKRIVNGAGKRILVLERETRPPSYIVPERIIHEISGELFMFHSMLFENYIDFFDSIEDLALGLATYSFTDTMSGEEE